MLLQFHSELYRADNSQPALKAGTGNLHCLFRWCSRLDSCSSVELSCWERRCFSSCSWSLVMLAWERRSRISARRDWRSALYIWSMDVLWCSPCAKVEGDCMSVFTGANNTVTRYQAYHLFPLQGPKRIVHVVHRLPTYTIKYLRHKTLSHGSVQNSKEYAVIKFAFEQKKILVQGIQKHSCELRHSAF